MPGLTVSTDVCLARVCVHGRLAIRSMSLAVVLPPKAWRGGKHLPQTSPRVALLPRSLDSAQPSPTSANLKSWGITRCPPTLGSVFRTERLHRLVPLPQLGLGQHRGSKHVSPQPRGRAGPFQAQGAAAMAQSTLSLKLNTKFQ